MVNRLKFIVPPLLCFVAGIIAWQLLVQQGIIKEFILPSPLQILKVYIRDSNLIISNALITFGIALLGIGVSIIFGIVLAVIMDTFVVVKHVLYPVILIFQIVPVLIFAPIMVLWFGYGIKTQLIVVTLMCFFPILLTVLRGFESVSFSQVALLKSMKANRMQILYWVKLPNALFGMWSGLRLVVSYAVTASVISEWIGALKGLGVLMIASQKSFLIERVFAVNFAVILLSLVLYGVTIFLEKICIPWNTHITIKKR